MSQPKRPAVVFAGLIIQNDEGAVLFMRRANTGFADGMWSLPGGRVDHGELLVEAAAREAEEEIGLHVRVQDLHTAHVLNKISDDGHTRIWSGTPENREPHLCSELAWIQPHAMAPHTESTDHNAVAAWRSGHVAGWT